MQKNRIKITHHVQKVSSLVMENLSYASIYNYIYEKKVKEKNIYSIIELFPLSKKNDRYKYWVTKHLKKIYKTQKLGAHISDSEYNTINIINKKSHLSMRLKLRKIQHKAIEHVWRPNGFFANELSQSFNK